MTMSDPIADMLTRIRNANTAKHDTVDVPASKMKIAIAEILLKYYIAVENQQNQTEPQPLSEYFHLDILYVHYKGSNEELKTKKENLSSLQLSLNLLNQYVKGYLDYLSLYLLDIE